MTVQEFAKHTGGVGGAVIRVPILFIAENGIMGLAIGHLGLFPLFQREKKILLERQLANILSF